MGLLSRTFAGTIWGQAGRIAEICLSLAFSVFVVRRLGAEDYGTYALIFSIVGVANLLCSVGLNEALTKFVPITLNRSGRAQVNQILTTAVLFRLALVGVGSIALYLACYPLASVFSNRSISENAAIIVAVFSLQNIIDLLVAFYVSDLNIKMYYVIRTITQAISIAIVLSLFSLFGTSVKLVLLSIIASSIAAVALYLWGVKDRLKSDVRSELPLRPVFDFALVIWLINLLTFGLGSQVDTLLIGLFLKAQTEIAYYNIAALILGKLYLLLTGWSVVAMPSLSEAFAAGGLDSLAKASDLYIKLQMVVLVPVLAFLVFHSQGLIDLLFGSSFHPSAVLLSTEAALALISTLLLSGVALNVGYVAGGEKTLLWLRILSGGLNIVLDIFLIPRFGAFGAILATGTSIALASLSEMIAVKRMVSVAYPFSFAGKLCLVSALAVLFTWWMPGNSWRYLLANAALYTLVLALGARTVKLVSPMDRDVIARTNRHLGVLVRYF